MSGRGKIVNDPVYGFIRFGEPEVQRVMDHPWFQRLRGIRQMGLASLVYPGAMHTRFHHSLGACHLMGMALDELRRKGVSYNEEECLAARLAILLHDVGHGPYSHALEHCLVDGISHEEISSLIMHRMNADLAGALGSTEQVFSSEYPKQYLHQLVSSQLDMDRMDYLNRDSYFTGVSEGVIGYDRILHMLTVRDGELMVEEKGVHSVEKFIIARRLMYWQVYLHKTVLGAEHLLINILRRAKELARTGKEIFTTPGLQHFFYGEVTLENFRSDPRHLEIFCTLDDSDVMVCVKAWQSAPDKVLSTLCCMLIQRRLYKVLLSSDEIDPAFAEEKQRIAREALNLTEEELKYFVFQGVTSNSTYNTADERIRIAMKDGTARDISAIDNPLVNQALARPVVKNYICYIRP